jgi:D-lactate dehydrogenase
MFGEDVVPLWSEDLPQGGAGRVGGGDRSRADAVYFQACVGTMFGPAEGGAGVAVAFESLAVKAGVILFKPDGVEGLCCGTPWKSKGILEGYASMAQRTVDALWTASDEGRLPVVCDNSSCSEGLVLALQMAIENNPERRRLRIVDAVDFAVGQLLPKLRIEPAVRNLVVHPTCSSTRAGSNLNLLELASVVADQVSVPAEWNCCAFAGDRGMLHPELTKSATARESAEVGAGEYDSFASCNRTCEIGMTRATGRPYQHIIELVDRSATPIPVNVRPSSE